MRKFRIQNFKSRIKSGFTLVEVLIAMSVSAVIGILLISLLSSNASIYSDQNVKITQGIELNSTVTEVEESIKSAAAVAAQYPPAGSPTYISGAEALVLALPALTAQGLVIENTYDYIVIAKDPQNSRVLRKKLFPDPNGSRQEEDKVLSTMLSKVEFSYLDSADQPIAAIQASKIGFIINVAESVATETQVSSVSGRVNIRNN